MKRESFGSRLGFILVSAGCAIGIGNVWRFRMWPEKTEAAYLCCSTSCSCCVWEFPY